jgi:cyclopropane fatty-acyl-phospholipid synthase-like methyltransferase
MRTRATEPELLDLEVPSPEMQVRVAGYLRWVNRWLGGIRAVAYHLRRVPGPVTVLDVAGGAGDIALALAARYPHVKPFVLDLSEWMLSLAAGLPRVRADALRLPLGDRSVDWVISTHFFHHLSDDQVVSALREFDRVARRGIVVNDLVRKRTAVFFIRLFTLWANRYVKADGPQSVRRGFLPGEIEALARRAGLPWLRVTRFLGFRFTLAGERP